MGNKMFLTVKVEQYYLLKNIFLLRVWSVTDKKLLTTLPAVDSGGHPTSVCWVVGESAHCVVGYSTAVCTIMDTETGNIIIKLDTAHDPVSAQVYFCFLFNSLMAPFL